jgi:mRNA interferase RelE/StbE
MRSLVLDNASRKALEHLPDKHFRQVISAIFSLLKNPRPSDSIAISGYPFYRISVGEYRVVYDFTEAQVRLLAFGKRNDSEVYRILQRKR